MTYEATIQQWREGERRLDAAGPPRSGVLHRVADRIYEELRRRLGSTFLVDELVAFYESGTEWAQDVARTTAPEDPWAWDVRTVVDGAFARYVREAADYAGGRRTTAG